MAVSMQPLCQLGKSCFPSRERAENFMCAHQLATLSSDSLTFPRKLGTDMAQRGKGSGL